MSRTEAVMWAKELRKQGVAQVMVHGLTDQRIPDAWQCGRAGDSLDRRQEFSARVVDQLVELGATKLHEASGDTLLSLDGL